MNRYQQRDVVLASMGFPSYKAYLASALWRRIRGRLFRVCSTCVCGQPATQIHHRTYKRRYLEGRGKIHKFLTPICSSCHKAIEFDGSEKLSLGWANSKLDEIRANAEARGIRLPAKTRINNRSKPCRERNALGESRTSRGKSDSIGDGKLPTGSQNGTADKPRCGNPVTHT